MTRQLKVLVYGATGAQGGPVVWELLRRGHRPYVVTRRREKAAAFEAAGAVVVEADMGDRERLRAASVGMDGVSLLIPFFTDPAAWPLYGRNAIDGVREAGVPLIVWNASGILPPEPTGNPSLDVRLEVAEQLRTSGIAHVILQPTLYAENLLGPYTVPFVVQQDRVAYPTPPDMRVGWIAAADVGALAVAALERPPTDSASYIVSGLENPDGPELAAAFSAALGRPMGYHALPPAEFGAILDGVFGPGAGAAAAGFYQELWDKPDRRPVMHVDMQPVLEQLPVRMRTMREWVAEHAAIFTSAAAQVPVEQTR